MSLAARIGRAIFWGQAGRLAEAIVCFLFYLFLARALGPTSYGVFALGISLAGVCGFIALLGLGPETLGRFLPEIAKQGGRTGVQHLLGMLFAVRSVAIFILCAVVWCFRESLLRHFHFFLLPAALLLILFVFAARSAFDLLTYFCSGLLKLRRVALAKLVASLVAPSTFLILWMRHDAGVQTAWLSVGAGALAGGLVLATPFVARGAVDISGRGSKSHMISQPTSPSLRRILAFGIFAWATNLFLYVLGDSMDVLLLGWLRPQREQIGYYAVGAKIVLSVTTLLLAWASLTSVAACSEALQQGGAGKLARTMEAQWKFAALCLIPPLAFLMLYAREIVTSLYSAVYAPSVPVVEILSALLICTAIVGSSIQGGILYAMNHERVACALIGGAAVFNFVSEVILVRHFGIDGAAVSTGLSMLIAAALCAVMGSRYVPVRFPFRFLGKVVAATVLAAACTAWLTPASLIELVSCGAFFVALFFAALAVLKPLTETDTAAIREFHGWLGGWAARVFKLAGAALEGR